MYSKVNTVALRGIDGTMVTVESDVSSGLPDFSMVGFLSSEVKEARERVKTALRNAEFALQPRRITVNLSPADIRKEGTSYDLAIALSLLIGYGFVPQEYVRGLVVMGELTLDGRVCSIRGVLPRVIKARREGFHTVFVPWDNRVEASVVEGIRVVGVRTLAEAVHLLHAPEDRHPEISHAGEMLRLAAQTMPEDFSQVHGQHAMKRAAEIAACGMHNLLFIGTPGSGKSMIARRMPGILPTMDLEESLAVSRVYSVAGMLGDDSPLILHRPFRSPHHTISTAALVGGGRDPRPGEISLADRGVLFLDELPEFSKSTLEVLRQPMEDREVTISRVNGSVKFPADTMVVAAMNPCACGYYPDRSRCSCGEHEVRRYLQRISRPLLDRIDICVEAPRVHFHDLTREAPEETSAQIRERVERVHSIQQERFAGEDIFFNSQMSHAHVKEFCRLTEEDRVRMQAVFESRKLSARAYHRVLKVSRTIADLEGSRDILWPHVLEAVAFRSLENRFWG